MDFEGTVGLLLLYFEKGSLALLCPSKDVWTLEVSTTVTLCTVGMQHVHFHEEGKCRREKCAVKRRKTELRGTANWSFPGSQFFDFRFPQVWSSSIQQWLIRFIHWQWWSMRMIPTTLAVKCLQGKNRMSIEHYPPYFLRCLSKYFASLHSLLVRSRRPLCSWIHVPGLVPRNFFSRYASQERG